MTLILVIPHLSIAHVFGICGMNINVIEMMNERRGHYYVVGSLLQSCHGLEAIWLLHWELFGDLHLLMFLGRHDWVLWFPISLLQLCLWFMAQVTNVMGRFHMEEFASLLWVLFCRVTRWLMCDHHYFQAHAYMAWTLVEFGF
jgi:hypothetical protein